MNLNLNGIFKLVVYPVLAWLVTNNMKILDLVPLEYQGVVSAVLTILAMVVLHGKTPPVMKNGQK